MSVLVLSMKKEKWAHRKSLIFGANNLDTFFWNLEIYNLNQLLENKIVDGGHSFC